ncbi:hypothetical protein [Bradyrhizobium elkanii]|uniref:hypothetical protein n=1 Tax=Bradyrhizobium elkanii TaxID=29448 RepID=UPI00159EF6E7|nr:hypothetical protein [Bradyrhizobium elkanii]
MGLVEDLREQQEEVDLRLAKALRDAGRSPLGMPSSLDTFKAWLSQAGLCLVTKSNGAS